MSAITMTLDLEGDASAAVISLLRQFPKGARVKVAVSEIVPLAPAPSLEEYRRKVAVARQRAPGSPWKSTAEAMKALREGEE